MKPKCKYYGCQVSTRSHSGYCIWHIGHASFQDKQDFLVGVTMVICIVFLGIAAGMGLL